jgi:hypothetical protein
MSSVFHVEQKKEFRIQNLEVRIWNTGGGIGSWLNYLKLSFFACSETLCSTWNTGYAHVIKK